MSKKIDAALEHGVGMFLFDWYPSRLPAPPTHILVVDSTTTHVPQKTAEFVH